MDNFIDSKDEQKLLKQKKENELARLKDQDDILWILSTAKGRRFLWKLISECGIYRTPYVPKDTTETHVRIGKQQIGYGLVGWICAAKKDAVLQMQNEFASEIKKEKTEENEDE